MVLKTEDFPLLNCAKDERYLNCSFLGCPLKMFSTYDFIELLLLSGFMHYSYI